MRRPDPYSLAALMAAILGLATWAGLAKGGLYPLWHEGDMLHMVQIVLREAAGEWPHLDFMTPLGVLAYAPIALFLRAGYPLAEGFVLGQALVGAVLLPMAWWAAFTRFGRGWAHLFGAGIMVLCVALVPATPDPDISLSMNYNRWGWAAAFVVLALAILPARWSGPRMRRAEGVILGLCLALLALTKITYFAACAPVAGLALLARRDRAGAISAAVTGLAAALVVTGLAGPSFWPAYLGDLLAVAGTDVRAFPSGTLLDVVGGTAARVGSVLFLVTVMLARRAGHETAGLLMLAAAPGLAYITYQNFGNDPVWLFFLGLAALALRPEKADSLPDRGLTVTGWGALLLAAPIFMAMAESPVRNYLAGTEGKIEVLPGDQGLWMPRARVEHVQTRVTRPLEAGGVWWHAPLAPEPTTLNGENLQQCRLISGLVGWFQAVAQDIEAAGYGGRPILVADMLNAYWLYGGTPLHGGAPWYYGGLPGIEGAELLLVPQCATRPDVRARMLAALNAAGIALAERHRTADYILMELIPSPASTR